MKAKPKKKTLDSPEFIEHVLSRPMVEEPMVTARVLMRLGYARPNESISKVAYRVQRLRKKVFLSRHRKPSERRRRLTSTTRKQP